MKAIGVGLAALLAAPAAMAQSVAGAPPSGAYFPGDQEAPNTTQPPINLSQTIAPRPQSMPIWSQYKTLRTCGMAATFGEVQVSLGASLDQPTVFSLKITGLSGVPSSGNVRVSMVSNVGQQQLSGTSDERTLTFSLDQTNFAQFLHDFTAGTSLTIGSQSAPPTQIDLTGTSAAISAFGQCTEADDFQQLPPPWHAPTEAEAAAAAAEAIYRSTADSAPPPAGDDPSQQPPAQQVHSVQTPTAPVTPPSETPAAPVAAEATPSVPAQPTGIVITALNCSLSPLGFGPHVQGMLTNDTGDSQSLMQIVEVFSSKTGSFVSTTNTFATYDPVLPGQASPFEDYGGANPVITTVQVTAATEDGEELPTSGQTTAACTSDDNPSF